MWGNKSPLYIQFLYMCYDLGSFLAPFWTKPFILRSKSELLGGTNSTQIQYKPSDVRIQYPIMMVGVVFSLSALGFLILHYTEPYVKPLPKKTIKKAPSHVEQFDGKRWLRWLIIILMCFFTHSAQSVTDLIGKLIDLISSNLLFNYLHSILFPQLINVFNVDKLIGESIKTITFNCFHGSQISVTINYPVLVFV